MSDILAVLSTIGDWGAVALSVGGAIIGVSTALMSSRILRRRLSVEQKLATKLHDYYFKRSQLEQLRKISAELEQMTGEKSRLISEYTSLVERLTRELADAEKSLIAQALNQPSKHGRSLYLRRLAKEAAMTTVKVITP